MRRCYPSIVLFAALIALVAFPTAGTAQAPGTDEVAIRAIVQSEGDAWNRGDAEAFGAHYAENGSFTNVIGQQLYGRKAFIAQHASIFSTIYKGSHNDFSVSKITFLRPDVALVEIEGSLRGANRLPPGLKADSDGVLKVKLLEVMTKESGKWLIAAFHNVAVYPLAQSGPPQ